MKFINLYPQFENESNYFAKYCKDNFKIGYILFIIVEFLHDFLKSNRNEKNCSHFIHDTIF